MNIEEYTQRKRELLDLFCILVQESGIYPLEQDEDDWDEAFIGEMEAK